MNLLKMFFMITACCYGTTMIWASGPVLAYNLGQLDSTTLTPTGLAIMLGCTLMAGAFGLWSLIKSCED